MYCNISWPTCHNSDILIDPALTMDVVTLSWKLLFFCWKRWFRDSYGAMIYTQVQVSQHFWKFLRFITWSHFNIFQREVKGISYGFDKQITPKFSLKRSYLSLRIIRQSRLRPDPYSSKVFNAVFDNGSAT